MFKVLKIPADSVHTARRGGALLRDSFVNRVLQSTTVHDGLLHPRLRHLLVASICGPSAAISCSYRDTGVPCSVVGPFL